MRASWNFPHPATYFVQVMYLTLRCSDSGGRVNARLSLPKALIQRSASALLLDQRCNCLTLAFRAENLHSGPVPRTQRCLISHLSNERGPLMPWEALATAFKGRHLARAKACSGQELLFMMHDTLPGNHMPSPRPFHGIPMLFGKLFFHFEARWIWTKS